MRECGLCRWKGANWSRHWKNNHKGATPFARGALIPPDATLEPLIEPNGDVELVDIVLGNVESHEEEKKDP